MASAIRGQPFNLARVRPIEKPLPFTGAQMQRLITANRAGTEQRSPILKRLCQRVEKLRPTSINWAFGLSLDDLIPWSVRVSKGSAGSLPAPLTFFKSDHFQWIPKVVIHVCSDASIDLGELYAYHITCRRASIEFLCITKMQISNDYLDSKHFSRAFNGAFFCNSMKNLTIFCPILRGQGFFTWTNLDNKGSSKKQVIH